MKRRWIALALSALVLSAAAPVTEQVAKPWYKQPFDPARVKPCDRACLAAQADRFLAAMEAHDPGRLPLAETVFVTENSARVGLGEGLLWHAALKPTAFRIIVADPVSGQVAVQFVELVEGRPAQVAVRLKIERHMISEIEQLYDRDVAPEAMDLLQSPRPALLADVPAAQRASRDFLIYAVNAYFDALTGEDGRIAPFARDCVRHEKGYRTVNNEKPGRAAPSPALPDPSTPLGKLFSQLSVMTCGEQVSTGIFAGVRQIWPRRLVIDEQKGLVAAFPLFIHDGTRRPVAEGKLGATRGGLPFVLNLVTMETFGIRGGQIHEVEASPFVTLPYGMGDGWTPATGRAGQK